jgi:hypothetical protein
MLISIQTLVLRLELLVLHHSLMLLVLFYALLEIHLRLIELFQLCLPLLVGSEFFLVLNFLLLSIVESKHVPHGKI